MIQVEGEVSLPGNHHALGFPGKVGHVFVGWPIFGFARFGTSFFGADVVGLPGRARRNLIGGSELKTGVLWVTIQDQGLMIGGEDGSEIDLQGIVRTQ